MCDLEVDLGAAAERFGKPLSCFAAERAVLADSPASAWSR